MFSPYLRHCWLLLIALLALSALLAAGCGVDDDDDDDDDDQVQFDYNGSIVTPTVDPTACLTADAKQAVELAPAWLRTEMILNLCSLTAAQQDLAAELVLGYSDPLHIDELAFMAAHVGDADWEYPSLDLNLFYDNVESLYAADAILDYVTLVEVGDPEVDDDFYTTAEYQIENAAGKAETVRIDPYYYYWYIVHPRLEDEGPRYIDPSTGGSAEPPDGVFWRDYFLNHADTLCPGDIPNWDAGKPQFEDPDKTDWVTCDVLADVLAGIASLWSGAEGHDNNGAMTVINDWVDQAMWFGLPTGYGRYNQPIRIYSDHYGYCGEHADITSAATRAALIPAANIAAYANDHTWNEFFDGDWHAYEPVNNNIGGFVYDSWWDMKGAYRARGDGFAENATALYSDTGTVNVTVLDVNNKPVDGATVIAGMQNSQLKHTMAVTDQNGFASMEVGDENRVYLSVISPLERTSPTRYFDNVVKAGQTYDVTIQLTQSLDSLGEKAAEEPGAGVIAVKIAFEPGTRYVRNQGIVGTNTFTENYADVLLTLLMVDADNYALFENNEEFQAYTLELTDNQAEFDAPHGGDWMLLVSNYSAVSTYYTGQLNVSIENMGSGEEYDAAESELFLAPGEMLLFELLEL